MISRHRSRPRTVIEAASAVSIAVFASPFLPINMRFLPPGAAATIGRSARRHNGAHESHAGTPA
jgi:hypothetical protein